MKDKLGYFDMYELMMRDPLDPRTFVPVKKAPRLEDFMTNSGPDRVNNETEPVILYVAEEISGEVSLAA